MFEFSEGPEKHLLRIRLTGFWSMDTLNAYRAAFVSHLKQVQDKTGRCHNLIDCSAFPIQSADVAAGFRELADSQQNKPDVQVAILLPGALAKLQAERAVGAPNVRFFFGDEDAALAWLNGA